MIFYFTGTGNSYAAAMKMQSEGEAIYNIADCVKEKQFEFELGEEEAVGFVFPVYFGGLPTIVNYFINKVTFLDVEPSYLYGLLTCGGMASAADHMFEKKLLSNGYELDAVFTVKMPDNYVVLYDVDTDEEAAKTLELADLELAVIRDKILAKVPVTKRSGPAAKAMTAALYPRYRKGRKTAPFWVDDQCVGCGACAQRCPSQAITILGGKPVWIKERCIFCLGCTNRCGAIQYGKKTQKRGRYKHPVFQKKHVHCEEE